MGWQNYDSSRANDVSNARLLLPLDSVLLKELFKLVEVCNRSHFEPIGARTEREFRYGLLPHLVVKRDHASLVCLRL